MSAEIQIQISGDAQAVVDRIADKPGLLSAMAKALDLQNEYTIGYIQQKKLSGPTSPDSLSVRTGLLRRSIRRTDTVITANGLTSSIGSNVAYAGIHEFGGTIPAHTIKATGRALVFLYGGKKVFARSVKHPGMTLPARRFIMGSLEERADSYSAALSNAIIGFWQGGKG